MVGWFFGMSNLVGLFDAEFVFSLFLFLLLLFLIIYVLFTVICLSDYYYLLINICKKFSHNYLFNVTPVILMLGCVTDNE